MSSPIWTPDALRSEARDSHGGCWRLVEAQHRVSTIKLVDTLAEQALLEDELEATKPPLPPACIHLDYLLATPFRYGRYPGNSRFRREGYSPGVFYSSEMVETAVAETAFYRLLFFIESPGTPWPRNALEFTAFEARYATTHAIDLTVAPFAEHRSRWTHPTDYSACLALADAALAAGIDLIRYQSVRDPQGGANLALLSCACFAMPNPVRKTTWRLHFSDYGVNAICDMPDLRLGFTLATFGDDPRVKGAARQ
ncbi:RES domain-containing protein [Phyllobacterium sp. SYP-B3895]|uniref:RES family NAD+ phosphorylase n=1 Tax=Phyllobacterium sp. SYP-B3895 TaxID=2663240 RepID=UPI001299C787|nr:RES family NAD+ phosphorylase [Phyllobacterium sp. SYP-B3895]MRG54293.1 RES domain-containing protein [Phyllobacterium sp. SYP-B3895]